MEFLSDMQYKIQHKMALITNSMTQIPPFAGTDKCCFKDLIKPRVMIAIKEYPAK